MNLLVNSYKIPDRETLTNPDKSRSLILVPVFSYLEMRIKISYYWIIIMKALIITNIY